MRKSVRDDVAWLMSGSCKGKALGAAPLGSDYGEFETPDTRRLTRMVVGWLDPAELGFVS
jgi:hypothetical protein